MVLPTVFDHLEELLSKNKVQLKIFPLPVRTNCLPTENLNGTPADNDHNLFTLVRRFTQTPVKDTFSESLLKNCRLRRYIH